MSAASVSVVIPFGGAARLPQLVGTLAGLRRAQGVDQVIVAEYGTAPVACAATAAAGAAHIFLPGEAPFDKVRAVNAGSALATRPDILWCDGDLLFGADFLPRALAECHAGGFDFFFPFSTISYLSQRDTGEVLAGRRAPEACPAQRVLAPLGGGAPGGMGLVRRDFLARHGGMIEGFRGWGLEDNAWIHKVRLLGRLGVTARHDQSVWHLFHADSGSHSSAAQNGAALANPHFAANHALFNRVQQIDDGALFGQHFPPPRHATPPWPRDAALAFLIAAPPGSTADRHAGDWAQRIAATYGTAPALVHVAGSEIAAALRARPAALLAGFAGDAAGRAALVAAFGARPAVVVPAPGDPGAPAPPASQVTILAADEARRARWAAQGWRTWQTTTSAAHSRVGPPTIVQPLSQLAAPRAWHVRIALDRAVLPPSALEQPRFWYVGMHDHHGVEVMRADADACELRHVLADDSAPIVIARNVAAPVPPASWTVWPTDRQGRWLDRIVGTIDDACLHAS